MEYVELHLTGSKTITYMIAFVTINNTKSSYETLGSLLFSLYINHLPNCSKKLSFRIFDEQTQICFTQVISYNFLKQS